MHLSTGPKENFSRPAINPLFRSAAAAYDSRVAGVILSGELDDGVSGLWELKRRGGIAIVQDPAEAASPSMPRSAVGNVPADYVVQISELAPLLVQLASSDEPPLMPPPNDHSNRERSDLTCPECRGPLSEERRGSLVEYSCRVGHVFTEQTMLAVHRDAQERALWAAIVALEEAAEMARNLAGRNCGERDRWLEEAAGKQENADLLRKVVNRNV